MESSLPSHEVQGLSGANEVRACITARLAQGMTRFAAICDFIVKYFDVHKLPVGPNLDFL